MKKQQRAQAKERQRLDDEIKQLRQKIENDDLPEETPIWQHLRALIEFLRITPKELANHDEIKGWSSRFSSILTPEATEFLSKDELRNIEAALTEQLFNIQGISTNYRQKMLNTLQREIQSIADKVWLLTVRRASPNPTEQPSIPKVAESKPKGTTPTERSPHRGTLKEITAADVEAFLRGELLPSYSLFTALMFELNTISASELKGKFNETLEVVNKKLVEQQEGEIPLLSVPLQTHLEGYEHGYSNFNEATLVKLQIIAEYIEHPEKTEIARLLNDIVRAAQVQRPESVEQLNKALENNDADLRVTAEQFDEIKKLTEAARAEWQKDWIE